MSKRISLPVHHTVVFVDADPDQVTPSYPESPREASHPGPLVSVDCVERVVAAGERANFDNKWSGMIAGHDVDFPTGDNHVPGDDAEALILQVEAGKELAKLSGRQPF
jgi:hypothetical protein